MRIVLDTNVFVSALIRGDGPPGRVLAAVRRSRVTLVTSEEQLRELRRVLGRKRLRARIHPAEAEDLIRNLPAVAEVVPADLPSMNASPDPDDNLILATAIAGRADLIVSGDRKHMLSLGNVQGIPIITAADAADQVYGGAR